MSSSISDKECEKVTSDMEKLDAKLTDVSSTTVAEAKDSSSSGKSGADEKSSAKSSKAERADIVPYTIEQLPEADGKRFSIPRVMIHFEAPSQ